MNIERKVNGLQIQHVPSRLKIDNIDFFESIGLPTISSMAEAYNRFSKNCALEAIARLANEGNMMIDDKKKAITDIAYSRVTKTVETALSFIPSAKPKIEFTDNELSVDYIPNELKITWDIRKPEFDYIPSKVHFAVKSWNKVIYEYVGGYPYFPPSSNPNTENS